jgi:hypothetical protein
VALFAGFQLALISSAPVSHSTDIILLSTNKGTFVFFTRRRRLADFFSSLDCPALSTLLYCSGAVAERKETLIQPTLCLPSAILNSGAACF